MEVSLAIVVKLLPTEKYPVKPLVMGLGYSVDVGVMLKPGSIGATFQAASCVNKAHGEMYVKWDPGEEEAIKSICKSKKVSLVLWINITVGESLNFID